ncbi:MAG: SDR family oxidoreductase [Planctomycetes bacterium]|nr:SDR family oxidoreductase [Planctomycetota bacterium]
MRVDFSGEVALVTGGSSGIGLALARALVGAGARVHVLDRAAPPAGEGFVFHECDLARRDGPARVVEAIVAAEARLDLLVQCAGITRDKVLWKLSDDDFEEVLAVNLTGAFRVLRAAVPQMRAQGRGRVVHIASINGMRGKFGQTNYSASKAGLIGLTRSAARELGSLGITVNAVAPGLVLTAMTEKLPQPVLEKALAETATGRLGSVEDLVGAVLFLLSDDAAHVTGEVLRVDGGQMS